MFKSIATLPEKTLKAHTLCVAPMLDWTDRHCRFFHRLLAPHALLYTEMVTTGALLHGDRARHLDYSAAEHPIALQLGGSEPDDLAACARMATDWGYDEINLNCGCPSERVQKGAFGACLMKEPALVGDCVSAMRAATPLPVTVKCRIGVDDCDDLEFLTRFVDTVRQAGCTTFIIHARKAWLQGLSPKENREIPPLRYDIAHAIKTATPDLRVILNGGIKTVEHVDDALATFDGVMVGRAAYETPYALAQMEAHIWGTPLPSRADIACAMQDYILERRRSDPTLPLNAVTRHLLGLFHAEPRGKLWRRLLTEGVTGTKALNPPDLISQALEAVIKDDRPPLPPC